MAKKTVTATIRLDENTSSLYSKRSDQLSPALYQAVVAFMQLSKLTLLELKGKFTKSELVAIIDTLNGTMREDRYMRPAFLLAEMEDSEKLDGISSRHEFDFTSFREKLVTLTEAQTYYLMDRIYLFWERESSSDGSLEALIAELT